MRRQSRSGVPSRRPDGVLSLPGEIALYLVLTVAYEWLRDLAAPGDPSGAVRNAGRVIDLERALGAFVEPDVQRFAQSLPGGESTFAWLYTLAHTPGLIIFLVWLWWRHRDKFGAVRTWFWVAHVFAVISFWLFPLAPPRLAGLGLADPTAETLKLGGALSWFQPFRNEFAAMPSLHVGYTFLFALTITMVGTTRKRFLAWLWPAAMLVVVVATANHYWIDGVGGAAVVLAALPLTAVLLARGPLRIRAEGLPWRRA